jgi:nucleoid-associated protein YgaU
MGTFEKLGILVIVVIIVMILAVAIYQWGGAGNAAPASVVEVPAPLTIRDIQDLVEDDHRERIREQEAAGDEGTWPGGIPKRYRIERDDKVWVLVFKRWGLKESFIKAIEAANPKVNLARLKPGQELTIPNPAAYVRNTAEKQAAPVKPAGARLYSVQQGDTLESIANLHLGAKARWPDILGMNPGLEPKSLFEGQEIYLPVK